MSRSVRTVCTTVTHSINFVTKPRADAPARCTVEREINATFGGQSGKSDEGH